MQKIKTTEATISKAIQEKDQASLDAFKMMSAYMEIYDELHKTCHLKNVKTIYLNRTDDSVIKLSNTLYTENRSLTRYRKIYLKCFKFCTFIVKKFGGLINFLNKLS